jgi:hypothetical protein
MSDTDPRGTTDQGKGQPVPADATEPWTPPDTDPLLGTTPTYHPTYAYRTASGRTFTGDPEHSDPTFGSDPLGLGPPSGPAPSAPGSEAGAGSLPPAGGAPADDGGPPGAGAPIGTTGDSWVGDGRQVGDTADLAGDLGAAEADTRLDEPDLDDRLRTEADLDDPAPNDPDLDDLLRPSRYVPDLDDPALDRPILDDLDDDEPTPDDDDEPTPDSHRTRRFRLRSVVLAMTAGLGVVAALVAVSLRTGSGGDASAGNGRPPAAAVPPGFINSARTDSDPVTPSEFFSDTRVVVQGHTYTRIANRLDPGCPDLTGDLKTTLAGQRCRQLVRAVYASEPEPNGRRVLAAISVVVVDEQTTARAAADAANAGKGGVKPLTVPAGALRGAQVTNPAGDTSWRAATNQGHYLIITQLAYTDGSQGAAGDQPLRVAISDFGLIAGGPIADRAISGHGPAG